MADPRLDIAVDRTCRFIDPDSGEVVVLPIIDTGGKQDVRVSFLGAFPPKQVIGDWTREHHEWLSALVQSDWQGGGQITDSQESTDTSRYYGIASLETRYSKALTLLPETVKIANPTPGSVARPLGDAVKAYGEEVRFYASYGTDLNRWDEATSTWDSLGDMLELPVNDGVTFQGTDVSVRSFWIPQGIHGYSMLNLDDDTLTVLSFGSPGTGLQPVQFLVWDNKLWALTVDGKIYRNVTGLDNDWTEIIRLETQGEARSLVRFVDQTGNPTLYALTTREVFVLDLVTPTAYVIHEYAPHPDAATASIMWDVSMFFTHGVDVGRYDSGSVTYIGLARGNGLPQEFRGRITGMAIGWNDLFALVEGERAVTAIEPVEEDLDVDLSFKTLSAKSALMRLDRLGGWHTVWMSESIGKEANHVMVSAAQGTYAVWWGFNNSLWRSDLPRSYQTPLENPTARFAKSGTLTSSWFDMNKTGMNLILSGLQVRHRDCTATERARVLIQIDHESSPWIDLGEITASPGDDHGSTLMRVGDEGTLPDGEQWFKGLRFRKVRYRIELTRGDDPTKTPVIDSVVVFYMPVMGTLSAFTVGIDCTTDGHRTYKGMGPRERQQFLERLVEAEFVPFSYREGEWFVCKVAGVSGADQSGVGYGGDRTVSLVAVYDL